MDLKEFAKNQSQMNRHPWEVSRCNILFDLMKTQKELENLNILDVGCGDLYVAQQIISKAEVSNYWAVDSAFQNESEKEAFLKAIPTKSLQLYSNLSGVEDTTADTVLLLDVIEHVENDKEFLNSIKSKCKNGALVFITVPAYSFLFSKHDIFLGHYRRYSLSQIRKLAQNQLGPVVNSGGFFFSLLMVRILQVTKEKLFSPIAQLTETKGVAAWTGGKILTQFISTILWIDYQLCRVLKLPGLSVFVVCRIQK